MTELGVTEDLVEKVRRLMVDALNAYVNLGPQGYYVYVESVLAAVVPEVRRAVAEEIAAAIEVKASDTSYSEAEAVTEHLLQAGKLAREIGGVQ